ncbi:synaptic vesicle glycoprotein 2B-like [Trichogramma pretiosum]|uniref:synaptic vesicle glycoprotein 2B-like n=1 Tax=Trichogramma pretiosum TaxID=7493 RepID=UPI0006C96707|nr:synaptic vesicle glycoprotein 2B-like [Trichogramma pretiosum]XP_023318760.1 synaptic vesicle glycoprotein 2B-like [Trichogramma pretiosum]
MYLEESVAQNAVEQTGFGRFNFKVVAVSTLMYLNCAFGITSIGFVITTAACDFQLTTIDKGRINAAPMLGMLIGSSIWGFLADVKGRRLALLLALFLQFAADALSSLVPSYWALVFLKFLSGVGVTGQLSISFTYLGEFQPTKYRHRILSWMEFSWAIGVIIVALLAWAVIPLDFSYKAGVFTFSSWNLFVLTSSLPAFFVWLWLLTLPETPKFLAETGQRDILLKVLTRMFVENTGKTAEDFREKLATCGLPSISCLVAMSENGSAAKSDTSSKKVLTKLEKFHHLVDTSKAQVKMLARKPYVTRLLTVGVIMFGMTSTYYSLMTWFPELFQRFAYFEANYPDEFASVCTVSKKMDVSSNLTVNINDTVDLYGCFTEIDTSVYVNSIWLGVACFPCAILLPLTVDYIGYQVYLLFTATVSCAVTIAFYFVKTSAQNLVLSCIFEAFTSINISVIFCILVEIFPTNLRVMATAITIFLGRLGSLFGNMLFGYLIDEYCSILIIVMAAQLFLAAALCWATPNRGKMRRIQNDFNDPS